MIQGFGWSSNITWHGWCVDYLHSCWCLADTYHGFVLKLYDDLLTWRSDLKKTAIGDMSISYSLLPPPSVPPQQHATWVESTTKDLLKGGLFLRFGIDENVSDLVLIATLLTARSTGENEEFRPSCPPCYLHCLLLHRALPDHTEAARSVPHAVAYIMLGLSCHSGNVFSSPQCHAHVLIFFSTVPLCFQWSWEER